MARVAVVTGGTRGIGAAISKALKAAGYNVAASYAGNDEAANKFKAETGINVYKWDVSSYDACVEGLKKVEADLGPVEPDPQRAPERREQHHVRRGTVERATAPGGRDHVDFTARQLPAAQLAQVEAFVVADACSQLFLRGVARDRGGEVQGHGMGGRQVVLREAARPVVIDHELAEQLTVRNQRHEG